MLSKFSGKYVQFIFYFASASSIVATDPDQSSRNVFTNETSILMPDNMTVIELRISVKNKDNSALQPVSKVLLSKAVMDQVIGAIGKAIEVEDKTEGQAIRNSLKTAFIKMSGDNTDVKNVTKEVFKPIEEEEAAEKDDTEKETAAVSVSLSENKKPVVTLLNQQKVK